MGPDEHPSREELFLMFSLMAAKFQQQAKMIAELTRLLIEKGVASDQEMTDVVDRLQHGPISLRVQDATQKLRDLADVHSTARQYLDHLEE